jgi:iron complex outermembrane receptor protein
MMHLASRSNRAGTFLLFCLLFAGIPPADAQTKVFNLPTQPAIKGIPEFARQAGIQILVSEKLVRDKQTAAVTGPHSIAEGLALLFKGTGLTATSNDGNTYTVAPAPQPKTVNESIQFNIPAGNLGVALTDFSEQSGLAVTTTKELTAGKKSKGARGTMKAAEALRRVLKGSGLRFVVGSDGALAIQANPSEGPSQQTGDTADVTVEGQQAKAKVYSGGNVDIPRTIDDVQPYYIFDSKTIEESGTTNIEDFLKQRLTMNTVAQTNSQSYGNNAFSTTTSSVNLRGLGTNETLILVDGRRMAGITNSGTSLQPDINGIPLAAIDRIEVLPSSASAIYGGSALGGVVNIILKKNYSGGEIRATDDSTWDGHAPIHDFSATFGKAFEEGKTHLLLTASYSDAKPMYLEDRVSLVNRGYANILQNDPGFFGINTGNYVASNVAILGSTPNIKSADYTGGFAFVPCGTPGSHPLGNRCYKISPVVYTNLTLKGSGAALNSPIATLPPGYSPTSNPSSIIGGQWNLTLPDANTPPNGLQVPIGSFPKTKSFMADIRRQMTDKLEFFAEFMYAGNSSFSDYNPIPTNQGVGVPSTASTNPFNQDVSINFPINLSTPQTSESITTTSTIGFSVKLPFQWSGEMDYTWSQNRFEYFYYNYDGAALRDDFANGTLNPFVDTLAHPLNLARYLAPSPYASSSTLNDIAWRASGPFGHLPWGDPTLSFALEHRKEGYPGNNYFQTYPLTPTTNSEVTYYGQSESTNSFYVEAKIPFVTAKNAIPGIESLELQLANRGEYYNVAAGTQYAVYFGNPLTLSYYSTADANGNPYHARASYSSDTNTFGLKYKPVNDLAIRASFAQAFLPPTYSQLLPNPVVNINGEQIVDPKNPTLPPYYVNTISGGNPNLTPQRSKNWDVGFIYEPQEELLKGLRLGLEFYKITQLGYITTLTGNQILNNPAFASRVTRDPTTGLVTQIDESYINAFKYETSGQDLSVHYDKSTSFGRFNVNLIGTFIQHEKRQLDFTNPLVDYVGWTNSEGEAKGKANAVLAWERNHWILNWSTTWFGGYNQFGAPGDPTGSTSTQYTQAQGGYRIPSQIYHGIFASYNFGSSANPLLSNLTIQGGIKNLFNTQPPFDAYYAPYYYSPYGDIRLRDYWLTVRKSFGL